MILASWFSICWKYSVTPQWPHDLVTAQDSEALLRESRAEQSAEAALKAQLAEERRKAQDTCRHQKRIEKQHEEIHLTILRLNQNELICAGV